MPVLPQVFCRACNEAMLPWPQQILFKPQHIIRPNQHGKPQSDPRLISDVYQCPSCGASIVIADTPMPWNSLGAIAQSMAQIWSRIQEDRKKHDKDGGGLVTP